MGEAWVNMSSSISFNPPMPGELLNFRLEIYIYIYTLLTVDNYEVYNILGLSLI